MSPQVQTVLCPQVSRLGLEAGELITLTQLDSAGPETMISEPSVITLPLLRPNPPPAGREGPQYQGGEALRFRDGFQVTVITILTLLTLHICLISIVVI